MMKMKPLPAAALMAALATSPGAGAAAQEMAGMAHAVTTPAGRAYARSMEAMTRSMAVTPTGDPDRDFVSMMLPHHRGAVDMARVELRYGRDPMLRKLATEVIRAQTAEIGRMQSWARRAR